MVAPRLRAQVLKSVAERGGIIFRRSTNMVSHASLCFFLVSVTD